MPMYSAKDGKQLTKAQQKNIQVAKRMADLKRRQKMLHELFYEYDADGNGFITQEEMASAIKRISGKAPSNKEMTLFMKQVDVNNDGVVSYEEFEAFTERQRRTDPDATTDSKVVSASALFSLLTAASNVWTLVESWQLLQTEDIYNYGGMISSIVIHTYNVLICLILVAAALPRVLPDNARVLKHDLLCFIFETYQGMLACYDAVNFAKESAILFWFRHCSGAGLILVGVIRILMFLNCFRSQEKISREYAKFVDPIVSTEDFLEGREVLFMPADEKIYWEQLEEPLFSHCHHRLLITISDAIDESNEKLKQLFSRMSQAKGRGVDVRLMTNQFNIVHIAGHLEQKLTVRFDKQNCCHHNFVILDDDVVMLSSASLPILLERGKPAHGDMLLVKKKVVIQKYVEEFENYWQQWAGSQIN